MIAPLVAGSANRVLYASVGAIWRARIVCERCSPIACRGSRAGADRLLCVSAGRRTGSLARVCDCGVSDREVVGASVEHWLDHGQPTVESSIVRPPSRRAADHAASDCRSPGLPIPRASDPPGVRLRVGRGRGSAPDRGGAWRGCGHYRIMLSGPSEGIAGAASAGCTAVRMTTWRFGADRSVRRVRRSRLIQPRGGLWVSRPGCRRGWKGGGVGIAGGWGRPCLPLPVCPVRSRRPGGCSPSGS